MSLLRTLLPSLLAVSAFPANAQPFEWSKAEAASGAASVELPCSQETVQTKERDGVEALRCDVSGVSAFLFVLKSEMIPAFGFPGSSVAQIRQKIEDDPDTEYLIDASVSGYPAFYSEGHASDGKVGFGVVEMSDGRVVMLNVQTDGSDAAEAAISSVFVRSWGSLQVARP